MENLIQNLLIPFHFQLITANLINRSESIVNQGIGLITLNEDLEQSSFPNQYHSESFLFASVWYITDIVVC